MKQEAKKRVIYKIDIFLIALQSIVAVLLGIQLIRMSIVPPLYMVLYFAIVLVVDLMGEMSFTGRHAVRKICEILRSLSCAA